MDIATMCLIPVAAVGGNTIANWIIDAVKSSAAQPPPYVVIKCYPCDIDRPIDRRENIHRAVCLAAEFARDHANCTKEAPLFGRSSITKGLVE